ncbi:STAS domain-containing protein [Rhodococcus sp. NPDC057014]|uniref:STAS domain-containing protein n=1 Tax=Rhodococcus sp. NPDC057014 TaxID=3346000 RepID=UPI003628120D
MTYLRSVIESPQRLRLSLSETAGWDRAGTDHCPFTLKIDEPTGGPIVLRLSGDVDAVTAPILTACLDEVVLHGRSAVVDLLDTTFVGSAALSALAEAGPRIREQRGHLTVAAPALCAASSHGSAWTPCAPSTASRTPSPPPTAGPNWPADRRRTRPPASRPRRGDRPGDHAIADRARPPRTSRHRRAERPPSRHPSPETVAARHVTPTTPYRFHPDVNQSLAKLGITPRQTHSPVSHEGVEAPRDRRLRRIPDVEPRHHHPTPSVGRTGPRYP